MVIQCTNPTCKNTIPVPEGASYVVCPVCNTWHFPSDFDNIADSSSMTGLDYGLPGEPTPSAPPAAPARDNPYPEYPKNDDVLISGYEPTFHKPQEPERKEQNTIAWIELPNGARLQLSVGRNIIGRNDLPHREPFVSRKHAVVEVIARAGGNGWDYLLYDIGAIEPQGSLNKVFIEGRSLPLKDTEKMPIYNGTVFSLGTVKLTLRSPI